MASPLIGCKERELVYISTEKLDLTIKGKPCHPKAEVLSKVKDFQSAFSVSCAAEYSTEIFLTSKQDMERHDELKAFSTFKTGPLFYEYQNYEVVIESKVDSEISFWHDNNLLREKVSYVGKSKKILSGVLNFGTEIGLSEFKIYVNGQEYLKVVMEIFPSKIDYQEDYINILRDVNDEIYNLAFDFLKRTYLWSSLNENIGSSLTEFFSIISIIFDKLKTSIDIILKTPHHVLQQETSIVPFHKIKKSNMETIKWLEKNPQHMVLHEGKYVPNKALVTKKNISFDTFENRFIKYILKSILKRLIDVKVNYTKLKRDTDKEIIKSIDRMNKEIEKRVEFSFLKDVGDLYTLNSLSLVLNMAPGYRDVYKYYLMLIKGLSLNGEVFKISVKDLALLYEYWCFIKLNSLLKNKYKLLKQDLVRIDNSGLFITLTKGRQASITYQNRNNGEKFILVYNPPIGGLPTVAQRPDNVLSLEKQRSKVKYEYIFDAKYRINPALDGTAYKQSYGLPGPEEDDINTMHRYRDAIVRDASDRPDFERTMFGAYILFPYNNEEEYMEHNFYKSINKVNIGGLPFLPSSTHLVEELLEELIGETPESAFERTTLPRGTYEYIENINFDERDVLVGSLRDRKQLEIALQHKFYHIPYKNIKTKGVSFKYIALYQSEKTFSNDAGIRYYGIIDEWKVVRRREITEIPKALDELYLRFNMREWVQLDKPIKPKEYGVLSHLYTNIQLLKSAEYLPELCIKNKEEYRLFMELKRLTAEEINVNNNLKNSSSTFFQFKGATVSIDKDDIYIVMDNILRKIPISSIISKSKTTIKLINGLIYDMKM